MGQVHAFDTHKYVKELQATGFKESQAESIIKSIMESRSSDVSHLATKEQLNTLKEQVNTLENKFDALDTKFESKIDALDTKFESKIDALDAKFESKIDALENKFDTKINALDAKFESKIDKLEIKLESKIIESQNTMIKWMIGIMFTFSSLILAALKLFF